MKKFITTSGIKTGEKVFGGTSYDELLHVIRLNDGNLLLSGDSYSPAGGDKTENNFGGPEETWIIKTDSNLVKLWDKTIFTVSPFYDDETGQAIQSFDGCIVIKNSTNAGIGGYKTQPSWAPGLNFPDYWIIKFCDTTASTNVQSAISHTHSAISISPNPTENNFTIFFPNTINKGIVEIYSVFGKKIFNEKIFNVSEKEIYLKNIASGIYFVKVRGEEIEYCEKLVIKN